MALPLCRSLPICSLLYCSIPLQRQRHAHQQQTVRLLWNAVRASYARFFRSIRTSMKHLLGNAAVISCTIPLLVGYQMIAKWWRFAVRRPTQAPAQISGTANLERRAEKLEAEGKLEQAMSKLLESHAAGSSNAGNLAHKLLQCHQEALDVRGCPLHQGGRKAPGATSFASEENDSLVEPLQTLPSSSSGIPVSPYCPRHLVADAPSGAADPCVALHVDCRTVVVLDNDFDGDPDGSTARKEEKRFALTTTAFEHLHNPPASNVVTKPELESDRVADVKDEDKEANCKEYSAAAKEAIGCETPWERGWQAPEEFAPPPESNSSVNSAGVGDLAGLRNFTVAQLNVFDGGMDKEVKRGGVVKAGKARPIYIALRGRVYDASSGRCLYGQGGEYSELAGHDVSWRVARGLRQSSSRDGGDGNLDDLSLEGMGRFEEMTLNGWEDIFAMRGYPVVGRVVATPSPSRAFSREELRAFRGARVPLGLRDGPPLPRCYALPPIYVGVMDRVFDVSFGGAELYTEGGPYECLAGRDASRVLARMSMSPEDVEGELDYSRLTRKELKNLTDWVKRFEDKGYPVVGWLEVCGLSTERED